MSTSCGAQTKGTITVLAETKRMKKRSDKGTVLVVVLAHLIASHQIVQGLDCVLHLSLP